MPPDAWPLPSADASSAAILSLIAAFTLYVAKLALEFGMNRVDYYELGACSTWSLCGLPDPCMPTARAYRVPIDVNFELEAMRQTEDDLARSALQEIGGGFHRRRGLWEAIKAQAAKNPDSFCAKFVHDVEHVPSWCVGRAGSCEWAAHLTD